VLNSDQILALEHAPRSLVVLGAGAVGVEFTSIFAALGSRVNLVEMLPRVLPLEDEEVSAELGRCLRRRDIELLTETRLERVTVRDESVVVDLRQGGGSSRREAEVLLVAIGRRPVTEGIGLEAVGIETDGRFISVDGFMRTVVPSIYAVGDLVETPMLAHVASAEGILAVEHLAGRKVVPLEPDRMPSATYCDPEVASVGLTEAEARARGFDVAIGKFPFAASGKAAIVGRTEGFVKVVREKRYDELLGVHIIGPHATDLIAEACVALQLESTTEALFRAIHAHPTLSESVAEAAHAALGAALHI
jgi:dihydrolipoamide dehydrogenase